MVCFISHGLEITMDAITDHTIPQSTSVKGKITEREKEQQQNA